MKVEDVKICRECVHAIPDRVVDHVGFFKTTYKDSYKYARCGCQLNDQDLVTGERRYMFCECARNDWAKDQNRCGKGGRFFEKKKSHNEHTR